MGNCLIKKYNVSIRPIDIGTGTSFDIKSLYPNDYQKFTASNFFVNGASGNPSTGGRITGDSSGPTMGLRVRLIKSYNASTGILSCYLYIDGDEVGTASAGVKVSIVPNLTKATEKGDLVYLGSGRSFNVSSKFPEDYMNMTTDNFLISSAGVASAYNRYYGGTFNCSGYGQLVLSYNSSTGTLSAGNNLIVTNDGGGYITSKYANCEVYASKKPIK